MSSSQIQTERLKSAVRAALPEAVYTAIHSRRVARTVDRYELRTVRHRYAGRDYSVVLGDPLAEGWYDHDCAEPGELAVLARGRLRDGAVVFDLGAHQAVVALMIAARVASEGRVIAVEAEPHNVEMARRNIELNDARNIELVHAAATRTPGTARFSPSLNGRVGTQRRLGTVEVRAVTVDQLSNERGFPDVLFVDVEGHELEVLRGASETLRRMPDVFIEVHQGVGLEEAGGTADEVIGVLRDAGYVEMHVSGADGQPYEPWGSGAPIPEGRFMLVAQHSQARWGLPETPR